MTTDTLELFGDEYTNVAGMKAYDDNDVLKTYIRPQGTLSITSNGTSDCTTYASVNVSVSGGQPNLQTKSKTYTPTTSQQTESITADNGYDGLQQVNVTVNAMPEMTLPSTTSASAVGTFKANIFPSTAQSTYLNIPSGYNSSNRYYTLSQLMLESKSITANGTYDASDEDLHGYSSVTVSVSGSSKNAQVSNTPGRATSSTYTAVGPSITVSKTGTYDVYWFGYRSSTSGTSGSQLYIGNTAYGTAQTGFVTTSGLTNLQEVHLSNVSLTQGQVLTIRARSRGSNYYMYIMGLVIVES